MASSRIAAALGGVITVVLAPFTSYSQTKGIPTSAELPCAGIGVVQVLPKPRSSTSRGARVTVSFAGRPCLVESVHAARPRGGDGR
jgi:hypothetical protein